MEHTDEVEFGVAVFASLRSEEDTLWSICTVFLARSDCEVNEKAWKAPCLERNGATNVITSV